MYIKKIDKYYIFGYNINKFFNKLAKVSIYGYNQKNNVGRR